MRRMWGIAVLGLVFFAGPAHASPWMPSPGLRWQYQLQGDVVSDLCAKTYHAPKGAACVEPDVFDIDLYNNDGTALNSPAVAAISDAVAPFLAIAITSRSSFQVNRPGLRLPTIPNSSILRAGGHGLTFLIR